MDQVKKLWLIQVTEARMELMETTKDKRDQISQSVEVIKRILQPFGKYISLLSCRELDEVSKGE